MTKLKDDVVKDTLKKVQVVYLDRDTAKYWNMRRRVGETQTFCAWFWVRGNQEGGPFKARSSALRDAYYRFVLTRESPAVGFELARKAKKRKAAWKPANGDQRRMELR